MTLATPLRLMTWNVQGSAGPDVAALAEAIRSFGPDIVAIQEIQSGQARQLARLLRFRRRWARKHFPYGVFLWWRAEGLAVLSPHGLEGRRRFVLSPGVHSWTYRRRIALAVTVRLPTGRVRVFNAHLASDGSVAGRVDQATILSGHIAQERQRAAVASESFEAVVLGDLNAHEEPDVLAPLVAAGFIDAWPAARSRSGDGLTAPAARPTGRIDYVLVGDLSGGPEIDIEIEVPPTAASWTSLSDHLPVIATLTAHDGSGQIRSK